MIAKVGKGMKRQERGGGVGVRKDETTGTFVMFV